MSLATRTHGETFAALALIAGGLTGITVDNNGNAGLALFVAGATGWSS